MPESVGVGVGVAVEEALTLLVAVGVGVGVPDPVELPVVVPEDVNDAVALLDREVLPLVDGEAPVEIEAVGVAEGVVLVLSVLEEVTEAVPVPVLVSVPVGVGVGVGAAVTLPDQERLPVAEALAPGRRVTADEGL